MEILGRILGTPARVKIMRLFLLNRGKKFTSKDVAKRSRVGADIARREIQLLTSVTFLKKQGDGWTYNLPFSYGEQFENLLLSSDTLSRTSILNHFKNLGRLKLVIVSGIFIKNHETRVDLLVVGDALKRKKIEEEIKKMEADIGVELSYAVFETKEFMYRISMYDKLVRDILDFPHEVIFQSKELSTQALKKA